MILIWENSVLDNWLAIRFQATGKVLKCPAIRSLISLLCYHLLHGDKIQQSWQKHNNLHQIRTGSNLAPQIMHPLFYLRATVILLKILYIVAGLDNIWYWIFLNRLIDYILQWWINDTFGKASPYNAVMTLLFSEKKFQLKYGGTVLLWSYDRFHNVKLSFWCIISSPLYIGGICYTFNIFTQES